MAERPLSTRASVAAILATLCLAGIGAAISAKADTVTWVATGAAIAVVWLLYLLWYIRDVRKHRSFSPLPVLDQVRCTTCGETVPRWFTEHVAQTGERICLKHIDGMPYPLPAETEDDFIARWTRDGKPRAAP